MILKRRDAPSIWVRLRNFLWPERGFGRAWRYMRRRVERLNDTPEKIALGFACGAFASFTPFFGFHFVVAALVAYFFRGNIVASLFGTIVGNPLTFPFIATASMSTGNFILGGFHLGDGENVIERFVEIGRGFYAAFSGGFGDGLVGEMRWTHLWHQFHMFFDQIMIPYMIGGAIWGTVIGSTIYFVLRPAIRAYQRRRRERLAAGKIERAGGAGAAIRPAH